MFSLQGFLLLKALTTLDGQYKHVTGTAYNSVNDTSTKIAHQSTQLPTAQNDNIFTHVLKTKFKNSIFLALILTQNTFLHIL